MQANEFDKKVQQMMEELKFSPSNTVWPQVEYRLREKRRRRRLIIFLPLLLAGLALLGYFGYQYYGNNENRTAQHKAAIEQSGTTISNSNTRDNSSQNPEILKIENETNDIIHSKPEILNNKEVNNTTSNTRTVTSIIPESPGSSQPKNDKLSTGSNAKLVEKSATQLQKPLAETKKAKNKTVVVGQVDSTAEKMESSTIIAETIATQPEKNDINQKQQVAEPEKQLQKDSTATFTPAKKDSSAKAPAVATAPPPQRDKLRWGIHASVGASSINDQVFPTLGGMKSMDNLTYTPPQSGSGNPPMFPSYPSDSRAGLAFQLGAFVQKSVTKRGTLNAGLTYNYYSDVIRIGAKQDSGIRFANSFSADSYAPTYYSNNAQSDYVNRYHLFEVPVTYDLRLSKQKKTLFNLNLGLTAGWMFATNGLTFDTTQRGIYYHDKDLYNKFQLGMLTGFSFTFNSKKSMPWTIGPIFRFSLSDLYIKEFDRNRYVMYSGINFKMLMPEKK